MRISSLLLIFVLSLPAVAAPRQWFEARLMSVETTSKDGVLVMPVGSAVAGLPVTRTSFYYKFATDDMEYVLVTQPHSLNLTVNHTTKLSLAGDYCYLFDDAGKQKKLRILTKVAKVKQ